MKRPFSDILGACTAVAVAAAVAVSSAWADTSPFVGRWHWNRAQSTLPPGEPPPTDLITEISRSNNQHLTWSVTIKDAAGQPHVQQFDVPANGQFQPIGNDTTAAFSLTDNSLQATFKGPSGQSDAFTCGLSTDKRKMTCNGTIGDTTGVSARYVDVYDRV
jgi:hypothetical protein